MKVVIERAGRSAAELKADLGDGSGSVGHEVLGEAQPLWRHDPRPPRRPRARAAVRPSLTLCRIRLRSISAKAARRNDPLLAAIELLRQLRSDTRRPLPGAPPIGHLKEKVRKLIRAGGRPDRRLYEVATFAVLRDRLRAGDIWVDGGRDYRPLERQLIARATLVARKDADIDPHSKLWGTGVTSSSDGQLFHAAACGARRSDVNAHYSGDPGTNFYTWVSDQHGHFHILPIGASEDEAPYVLDGLYGHESRFESEEHFADTGGANDHVFGLFSILDKRFAPRLRDLKDWRLHAMVGADAYPAIKRHIGDRIDPAPIREAWDELLRIGLSIQDRAVAPSTVLKKLAALPRSNLLSRALREIGRIERTLFMIEWYSSPALRGRCRVGLNKGEAGNKLTRAVFFHERGEIRDGSFESQAFRASGLNVVVSAIILWNTVYLSRVAATLRAENRAAR
jgi:TnpA family transposase